MLSRNHIRFCIRQLIQYELAVVLSLKRNLTYNTRAFEEIRIGPRQPPCAPMTKCPREAAQICELTPEMDHTKAEPTQMLGPSTLFALGSAVSLHVARYYEPVGVDICMARE